MCYVPFIHANARVWSMHTEHCQNGVWGFRGERWGMLHSGCPQVCSTFRCSVSVGVLLHVTTLCPAGQSKQPSWQSALQIPTAYHNCRYRTSPDCSRVCPESTYSIPYRVSIDGEDLANHHALIPRFGGAETRLLPLSLCSRRLSPRTKL